MPQLTTGSTATQIVFVMTKGTCHPLFRAGIGGHGTPENMRGLEPTVRNLVIQSKNTIPA